MFQKPSDYCLRPTWTLFWQSADPTSRGLPSNAKPGTYDTGTCFSLASFDFLADLVHRDVDFDIENDQDRCLNGLVVSEVYNPADVQRLSELFDNPQFFVGGPYSNEIIQGQKCSNCWFISALAATSTVKGLVEKYCVAVTLSILFPRPISVF